MVIHQTPGGEDDDHINMAGLDAGFLDSVILDGMMDGSNLLLVLFFPKKWIKSCKREPNRLYFSSSHFYGFIPVRLVQERMAGKALLLATM